MTLHTRVMVTSPGLDPRTAFDKARELIGATDAHRWTESRGGFDMEMSQGLPALMWVEHNHGELVSAGGHDDYCDEDCSGEWDDIAGHVVIHFDTAYAYTAPNGASCSDLHAWLVQQIGEWLSSKGATWQWYDESGDGWLHGPGWGTLGDPEVGRLGSTSRRTSRDPKRDFVETLHSLIGLASS